MTDMNLPRPSEKSWMVAYEEELLNNPMMLAARLKEWERFLETELQAV